MQNFFCFLNLNRQISRYIIVKIMFDVDVLAVKNMTDTKLLDLVKQY